MISNPRRLLRRRALRWVRRLIGDTSGVALVELGLVAPLLGLLLANVTDFARLIWSQMQCDYAAQVGTQAMFKTCANGTLPATKSGDCSYSSALTTAVQSTALGTSVSLASGYPEEYYYCACASGDTNGCSAGTLVQVGTVSSPPSPDNCSGYSTSGSSISPGDYVLVHVSYSYAPLFGHLTLASSQTLTGQSLIRLQ